MRTVTITIFTLHCSFALGTGLQVPSSVHCFYKMEKIGNMSYCTSAPNNHLGESRFSTVFKGNLHRHGNVTNVAVKRFSKRKAVDTIINDHTNNLVYQTIETLTSLITLLQLKISISSKFFIIFSSK